MSRTKKKTPQHSCPCRLPVFKGCTVDFRLREFRRVDHSKPAIEFIPFDSPKGRKLLQQMQLEAV